MPQTPILCSFLWQMQGQTFTILQSLKLGKSLENK